MPTFYQKPIKDGPDGYEAVRQHYADYLNNHAFGADTNRWNQTKALYRAGFTIGHLDLQNPKKKTPEKKALAFLDASESILDAEVQSNNHLEKTYLSDGHTTQCAENVTRLFTTPQDQSESTETDQINTNSVPIRSEFVPDALFDSSIKEYTKVFVMIAANANRPGGGLWWGTAQEEAVYAASNLVLYAAPYYDVPASESPLTPLSRMGYTYVQHDATAFQKVKPSTWVSFPRAIIVGGILSGLGVGVAGAVQLFSSATTMNSIALIIANAGVVAVNAMGVGTLGTLTLPMMTTFATIQTFVGAGAALIVGLILIVGAIKLYRALNAAPAPTFEFDLNAKQTFSPIYAANPDFRAFCSMNQDHLLTSAGHQEFISISYTNYYQTIAHAAEFKEQNPDQNTLIKLNAIGCGAFFNPHFLVAATARLAIEDARKDFPDSMPNLQFSIGGGQLNDEYLRATFKRIMHQTPLKDVRLMLDPSSPSYRAEMLAFATQREPDQRSYGDRQDGPGDFLNKIKKAQMETSELLGAVPRPSNALSNPAVSAPSTSSKSRATASNTAGSATPPLEALVLPLIKTHNREYAVKFEI